jgi:hypothetical protein
MERSSSLSSGGISYDIASTAFEPTNSFTSASQGPGLMGKERVQPARPALPAALMATYPSTAPEVSERFVIDQEWRKASGG